MLNDAERSEATPPWEWPTLYVHGRSGGICQSAWVPVAGMAQAEAEVAWWLRRWDHVSAVLWDGGVRLRGWNVTGR